MAAPTVSQQEQLLLRPREAAQRLGISERLLWQHSAPRGPIPTTRIGNAVRYSPEALQRYIEGAQALGLQGLSVVQLLQKIRQDVPLADDVSDDFLLAKLVAAWNAQEGGAACTQQ